MYYRTYFALIIYKQLNFCRFKASAYTNVDRLIVFLYNLLTKSLQAKSYLDTFHSVNFTNDL